MAKKSSKAQKTFTLTDVPYKDGVLRPKVAAVCSIYRRGRLALFDLPAPFVQPQSTIYSQVLADIPSTYRCTVRSLWSIYVDCPEEKLASSGMELREHTLAVFEYIPQQERT